MSTAELKSYLHQLIVETNDNPTLKKMKEYFVSLTKEKNNWWETISDNEKKAIEIGQKQLRNGDGINHKEARKRIDKILLKK